MAQVTIAVGMLVEGTRLAWTAPFIDPAVLALVCLAVLPLPLPAIRRAFADILLMTPEALRHEVEAAARAAVVRYGFLGHHAYVAQTGRARQIELHFLVPTGWPPRPLEAWDAIRDEVGAAIGGEGPDRWLTIAFTTDPEWAA